MEYINCYNIKEIIIYSYLSHKLLTKQKLTFLLCCKSDSMLKLLPYDIIQIIINLINRNNWINTKNIYQKGLI
jgi:hypothetical protein